MKANVLRANVHLGKCLSWQTSNGQMSSGQMSYHRFIQRFGRTVLEHLTIVIEL
jgi:hypothetical protein